MCGRKVLKPEPMPTKNSVHVENTILAGSLLVRRDWPWRWPISSQNRAFYTKYFGERPSMLRLSRILALLKIFFAPRAEIILENIALRHQVYVLSRQSKRPQLRLMDRALWVWLSRMWAGWRAALGDLARVFYEPRSRRVQLLHCAHVDPRRSLRLRCPAAHRPPAPARASNGQPYGGLDHPADPRGVSVRRSAEVSSPRQRLHLRRRVLSRGREHGHQGSPNSEGKSLAESFRGKNCRIYPPSARGSHHSHGTTSPSANLRRIPNLLQ